MMRGSKESGDEAVLGAYIPPFAYGAKDGAPGDVVKRILFGDDN
jgi:hypothetical protein